MYLISGVFAQPKHTQAQVSSMASDVIPGNVQTCFSSIRGSIQTNFSCLRGQESTNRFYKILKKLTYSRF